MHDVLVSALAATVAAGALIALSEVPAWLTFTLSCAALGAIVGQGVAAYRAERTPTVNTTRVIFLWTVLEASVGVVFQLVDGLL